LSESDDDGSWAGQRLFGGESAGQDALAANNIKDTIKNEGGGDDDFSDDF